MGLRKRRRNKFPFKLPLIFAILMVSFIFIYESLPNKNHYFAKKQKFFKPSSENKKIQDKVKIPSQYRNADRFYWEKRKESDFEYPLLRHDRFGNYEPNYKLLNRKGPGEYGKKVHVDSNLTSKMESSVKEFGINVVVSDRISLERAPDDLRHEECRHWDYPPILVPVSVIVVFHNEAWSPLMRTIHNVIKYSPKHYLHEIVMIDDCSYKDHLKEKLDLYINQFNGLVKLYRNTKREGLIRSRNIGARKATGEILVYLDAHCEAEPNWLPPLITPILNDFRTCTVPLIDAIDGNTFNFNEQGGGDSDGFARGAFDWNLAWQRIPLTKREKSRRERLTEPYRSPAMAGGLFAIDRKFFFEIGLYDNGLNIWGGENFELSYKVWMCGGQLLFVPCSRVGHIYRLDGWNGNPLPDSSLTDSLKKNYRRVIDIWWDEYKKFYFMRKPQDRRIDPGNLEEQKALRRNLQCRSFHWFMSEIAYDIPMHYPLIEPPAAATGKIKNIAKNLCLGGKFDKFGSSVTLTDCNSQLDWSLCWREDIRYHGDNSANHLICLDSVEEGNPVKYWECHNTHGNQLWKYLYYEKHIFHPVTTSCLSAFPSNNSVSTYACDSKNPYQLWEWNIINISLIDQYNIHLAKPLYTVSV